MKLHVTALLLATIAMGNTVVAQTDRDRADKAGRRPLAETRHRVLLLREQAADQAALAAMQERQRILNVAKDGAASGTFERVLAAVAKPPAEELDARRARLQAHVAVFQDWAARTFDWSDKQWSQLDEILKDELRAAEMRWGTPPDNRRKKPLSDFTPIVFTQQKNTENILQQGRVAIRILDMLADDQQMRWFEALDERRQSVRTANLDYIVSMVDEEISLTPEQRGSFTEALRERIGTVHHRLSDLESGLFTIHEQPHVLKLSPLSIILRGLGREILTPGQQLVMEDLISHKRYAQPDRVPIRIGLSSDTKNEELRQQELTRVTAEERLRFEEAVVTRVAVLDARWSLSDQQKRALIVAGKGVAERRLADWRTQAAEQLAAMEDGMGGFRGQVLAAGADVAIRFSTTSLESPSVDSIDTDELWLHTLEKVKASVVAKQARPFRREALVGYVTGMLDKELWLTPDQREPLRELVDAAFPQVIEIHQPDAKEFELLVVPLFGIPGDQLTTVLREPQLDAWNTLRSQFERLGDRVILRMEDGRSLTFQRPW